MKEMTRHECDEVLDQVEVAHIGVIDGDEPYVSPISLVRSGNLILLRTAPGRRLDAIRRHPKVSLEATIVDAATGDWMSVIVSGVATEVNDPVLESEAVARLLQKYDRFHGPMTAWAVPELLPGEAVVLSIRMERVTGRSSGSGHARSARPGRL